MNARDEYRDDWSLRQNRWHQLTQTNDGLRPPMAGRRRYTEWDLSHEFLRGVRSGWIGAGAFYAIATVVLILAFRFLGGAS